VPEDQSASAAERLVGTWGLVSFTLKHPTGRETHPYGTDAVGMLVYDDKGHMSGQIMSRRRPLFANERPRGGSDHEVRTAFEGYIAYFGRYTVDEVTALVTHHVDGALLPNWIASQQKRMFAFREGHLVLSAKIEVGMLVEIIWKRRSSLR
jgi:Lipocalin-like domain